MTEAYLRFTKGQQKIIIRNFFPAFLVLGILILGIFTFVASSRRPVNIESQAFVQALLAPPTNAVIGSKVDNFNKEVDLTLTWEDNTDYEIGFVIYWYIDDYATGFKKYETPNLTQAQFYSFPCSSTQQSHYIYILLSAYSADDVSMPATAELTVNVPACSDFIEEAPANPFADINRDKRVDILDYSILFQNYDLRITKDLMCEIVE